MRNRRILIFALLVMLATMVIVSCGGGGGGGGGGQDTTPPKVSSTNPSNSATGVATDLATITATFSEEMDSSTITNATFLVTNATGSVSYNSTTHTATFTLASALTSSATYTATITTGAKDLAGNPMSSSHIWSFQTSAPTSGILDPSFGNNGTVITSFGLSFERGSALAIQSDGKIVEVGAVWNGSASDFGVARFNADGTLDTSFGTGGKVITSVGSKSDSVGDVAIQSDGKIVVVGGAYDGTYNSFAVIRYNTNGSLDTTFGGSGIVTTSFIPGFSSDTADAVVIQSDGKIVVGGDTHLYGSQDYDFALVRYTSTGALDTAFGSGGMVTTAISVGNYYDGIRALALQTDGKIVATGTGENGYFATARYTTSGSLDTSFSGDGIIMTSFGIGTSDTASDVVIQSDGKIVVVGTTCSSSLARNFALVRYTTGGSIDTTFGGGTGQVVTATGPGQNYAFGAALQTDGKLVVVGETWSSGTRVALARYLQDGSLDTGFGIGGKTVSFEGMANDVAIAADGGILVAGEGYFTAYTSSHFALARYIP